MLIMIFISACPIYLIYLTFQVELVISACRVASHKGCIGRDERTRSWNIFYDWNSHKDTLSINFQYVVVVPVVLRSGKVKRFFNKT